MLGFQVCPPLSRCGTVAALVNKERPATVAAALAGGRCSCASKQTSPAASTLNTKPGRLHGDPVSLRPPQHLQRWADQQRIGGQGAGQADEQGTAARAGHP